MTTDTIKFHDRAAPTSGVPANVALDVLLRSREYATSGDWYDVFVTPTGYLAVTLGDACGHDAAASEAATIMQTALHWELEDRAATPAQALAYANTLAYDVGILASAVVVLLDVKTGRMRYALAGHPYPCYRDRSGHTTFLNSTGVLLGVLLESTYRTETTTLDRNSLLVLYTDGLVEHQRDLEQGLQSLAQATARVHGHASAAHELYEELMAASIPADDVTIVTLHYHGAQLAAPFWYTLPQRVA